jgi:hypothetical protein
MAEEIFEFF